jgi:hypothetical protein
MLFSSHCLTLLITIDIASSYFGWVKVFNTTFNNISVISWWTVLLVEKTAAPGGNHRPGQVIDKLYHIMQCLCKGMAYVY